ncbi:MAG: hypothetical protein HY828_18815 [Actinobacteria bacterium]|nr:hypothetical protein [Actinomycetota bacterium]
MILHQTFDRSSYWGASGNPSAKGWAVAIKTCFDTYVDLASSDDRRAIMTPIKRDVWLGEHSIGVAPDVVLIDPVGYVGRLVLWDTPATSQEEAELLAGPIVIALEEELGEGRTAGVEVWHLRSGQRFYVTADVALRRVDEARAVLDRYVS